MIYFHQNENCEKFLRKILILRMFFLNMLQNNYKILQNFWHIKNFDPNQSFYCEILSQNFDSPNLLLHFPAILWQHVELEIWNFRESFIPIILNGSLEYPVTTGQLHYLIGLEIKLWASKFSFLLSRMPHICQTQRFGCKYLSNGFYSKIGITM